MKLSFSLVTLAVIYCTVESKTSPPKVEVYSRNPGVYGMDNNLICHVSQFHPPDIKIDLLKNGAELPEAVQTDLAFEQSWQFHITKSVPFNPAEGQTFICRVTHEGKTTNSVWEPDM